MKTFLMSILTSFLIMGILSIAPDNVIASSSASAPQLIRSYQDYDYDEDDIYYNSRQGRYCYFIEGDWLFPPEYSCTYYSPQSSYYQNQFTPGFIFRFCNNNSHH